MTWMLLIPDEGEAEPISDGIVPCISFHDKSLPKPKRRPSEVDGVAGGRR